MANKTGARSLRASDPDDHSARDRGGLDASDDGRHTGRTPAQWYCLLAGAGLLLAGLFGWIADATFDTGTGDALQGDSFLGFEVNGWHNLVHLLSGIVLLAAFSRRKPAKTVALAFGVVYGLVTLIGLVDGNDVFGLLPVNPADNILHLALSAAGILAALVSPTDEHRTARDRGSQATTGTSGHRAATRSTDDDDDRFGRDVDPRTGRPRDDRTITGK
jgi:Domain of unknown function (DUF4383)